MADPQRKQSHREKEQQRQPGQGGRDESMERRPERSGDDAREQDRNRQQRNAGPAPQPGQQSPGRGEPAR